MLRKVKRKTNKSETYGSLNLLNAKDDHSLFKFHVMGDIQDGLPAHAFYHASTPVFLIQFLIQFQVFIFSPTSFVFI